MRKIAFFTLLALILIIPINKDFKGADAISMNGYRVSYSSNIYDPQEAYQTVNAQGTVGIMSGANKDNLVLRYELYSPLKFNGSRSYSSAYIGETFNYPKKRSISYSFSFQDVDNIARNGITIRFGIYDKTNREYINYIESHIYNILRDNINIDEIDGDLIFDRCLYLSENKTLERFNFSNFSHLLDSEYYYRLSLSNYSFTYESHKTFTLKEAYLSFKDENNLFPYIKENNEEKIIPIKWSRKNSIISMSLNSLYVEPLTLSMSSIKRSGYTQTGYLYYPKNKMDLLQGYPFTIHVKEAGINYISFDYTFYVSFDSRLIGPCNESKYCIVGGLEA